MLFTAEIFDISHKEFVSFDCKYVLGNIRASRGLYVKSMMLQISIYA